MLQDLHGASVTLLPLSIDVRCNLACSVPAQVESHREEDYAKFLVNCLAHALQDHSSRLRPFVLQGFGARSISQYLHGSPTQKHCYLC